MFKWLALAALLGSVAVWIARRAWSRRSYDFRLGTRGLWIDREFYHWHRVVAVTHYQDLGTLLVKIARQDEVPLAVRVDLGATRYRNWPPDRIEEAFAMNAVKLSWKSV